MIKRFAITVVAASVLLHSAAVAQQAPLRIGLVYCFSGPFALAGAQVDGQAHRGARGFGPGDFERSPPSRTRCTCWSRTHRPPTIPLWMR